MDNLDELVDRFRRSGVPIDFAINGAERPVPWPINLAAYRILQESLTNAARHSPGASTSVSLEYGVDRLIVSVENDRSADVQPRPHPAGHGIVGMRERTSALGGTFRADARADGGFAVHATLPVGRASAR